MDEIIATFQILSTKVSLTTLAELVKIDFLSGSREKGQALGRGKINVQTRAVCFELKGIDLQCILYELYNKMELLNLSVVVEKCRMHYL